MDNNSKILLEKLQTLSKNSGSIIFSIGDYYVQFARDKHDKEIYFEAVSHYFLDIIPKTIKKDFSKLNFNIDEGNYYKKVNTENIEIIVSDVQEIFENIYRVNYDKQFEINDDIEYSANLSEVISDPQVKTGTKTATTQTNPLKGIILISVFILLAYYLFFSSDKKKVGDLKSEACIISKQFVEMQMLSPKSAEFGFCDDSKISYLENNRYQVINYVDASNAFGASLRKNYLVILKYNKGEWGDINNWTLEKIEIE